MKEKVRKTPYTMVNIPLEYADEFKHFGMKELGKTLPKFVIEACATYMKLYHAIDDENKGRLRFSLSDAILERLQK